MEKDMAIIASGAIVDVIGGVMIAVAWLQKIMMRSQKT